MTEQSLPEQDGASLLGILDELTEIVLTAKPVPMSASVRVNRAELLALLDSAKNVVPASISTAEAIVAESEDVRTRAQHEAQRLVADAHTRADETVARAEAAAADAIARAEHQGRELIADERVVHMAEQRAREIVAEARAEAARLADQANSYCDDRLAGFEADLASLAKQVAGGREAVAQRRATAAEDLEAAHAAAAEARRRGTQEDPARLAPDTHPDAHPDTPADTDESTDRR